MDETSLFITSGNGPAECRASVAALIDIMPACYADAPYNEIEAKAKEEAIRKLSSWQASYAAASRQA